MRGAGNWTRRSVVRRFGRALFCDRIMPVCTATLFACDIQGLHGAVIQSGPCSKFSHVLLLSSAISISAAKKGSELVTSPDRVTPVSLCATLVPLEATWNIMKVLFLPGWGTPRFPIHPRHHVPSSAPTNVSLSLPVSLSPQRT